MAKEFSPMMKQYFEIKKEYSDCILFYRLGDFYEMFFDDAKVASRELELTLTGRECGQEERAPMCGVPFHSCESYIARLIDKGYKVAICEQTEDPKAAKGIVARDVVRVITPGTVIESSMLENEKNNYICTLYLDALGAGLCFADISTGEVDAIEITSGNIEMQIASEIGKYLPREIIVNISESENKELVEYLRCRLNLYPTCNRDDLFDERFAREAIENKFKTNRLRAFGFTDDGRLIRAVGAMLIYLSATQKRDLAYIEGINFYSKDSFMQLDNTARRNLELCETMRERQKRGTLLWVLDKTRTAMGSRLLRKFIDNPLMDVNEIVRRQDAVNDLVDSAVLRGELGEILKNVLDIERLCGKAAYGIANGRDLISLKQAVRNLPLIKNYIANFTSDELCKVNAQIDTLEDIYELISVSIEDEPPATIREGKLIKAGYNAEVDELKNILNGGTEYIRKIEESEREKTGIKNLKVGYNRVFGYYIEVSKSNVSQVPEEYIRKQTLTNGERFITQELKNLEATILSAQERIVTLEAELFRDVCAKIVAERSRIRITAQAISKIDVYTSLAEVAVRYHYVRPIVDNGDEIEIIAGRHPVVERMLRDVNFVPNDTVLDCNDNRMAVITGPNMAGKSTYMRQVALITIMAQIGSFVPADSVKIGVVDKVFTRIGASDDLSAGQSTFMVEMSEVADIIKNATRKSLLILDEIGRGTSTFDGMSIARAVIEYISNSNRIGAKTLFATHYHELTELEGQLDGVKNYNVAVKKVGFDITFLRKIMRGGADDSYGIEVAKLAGLPENIIHRAKEILTDLERGDNVPTVSRSRVEYVVNPKVEELLKRVTSIDINSLTPLDAQRVLYNLISEISSLEE